MSKSCFIIQPFDGEKFDSRYEDTFKPAIENANLKPYRVDKDPSTLVPIDDIERGIQASSICFAEISTDNPNIWYELGYASSQGKRIVMVCEEGRKNYPFDIQHRSIISYKSNSKKDFERLEEEITKKLKALMAKDETTKSIVNITKPKSGLEDYEIACLISVLNETTGVSGVASLWTIESAMKKTGHNPTATKLALRKLLSQNYIKMSYEPDENPHSDETYEAFSLLDEGWGWVEQNKKDLNLKIPKPTIPSFINSSADIPF